VFPGPFFGAVNSIISGQYKGQAGALHGINMYVALDGVDVLA